MVIRGRLRGRLAALAAVIAVAPGLAACGDDESSQDAGAGSDRDQPRAGRSTVSAEADEPAADPIDDEAEIVKTLEAVLAGGDPASACGDSVTERFLRRSYGDAAGCEAAQKAAKPADDAGVSEVVINPESVAQALAHPRAASTTARSCGPSSSWTTTPGSSTRCARTSPSVPVPERDEPGPKARLAVRNVSGGQTPRGWAPPERWKASITLGSMTSPATPITT